MKLFLAKKIIPLCLRYIRATWVPLLLLSLLLLEETLFNVWIGLSPNPYPWQFLGATLALGALLFGPAILLSGAYRYSYLFLVSLPIALILIAEDIYYSYAQGFLQASALAYAGQAADEEATILTLLAPHLLLFLFPLLLIPALYFGSRKKLWGELALTRKEKAVGICVILIIATIGFGSFVANGKFTTKLVTHPYVTMRDMNNFVWAPDDLVKRVGIVNYYVRDLIGFAFRHTPPSDEDVLFSTTWIAQKTPKKTEKSFGIATGRDLIFVQVESLEGAVIGQRINGQEITPNLNRLTRKGLYFSNYYTQVGPGNTADAEFVTLNSLYPLSNTVAFIDYAHNTYTALPQILKAHGYRTMVLHDDVPTFWNRSNIYPALGYTDIKSKEDFTDEGVPIFGHLGDVEFFEQTLTKIRALPSPFMATVITLSSHTPFIIPEELRTLDIPADADLTETQRNYLESIHYTDRAIGTFIDGLTKAGIAAHALIAIYGDHGSFTDISAKVGTSTNIKINDLRTNHVPLFLLAPGALSGKTLETPGSHLDLSPTVLNLLGIEEPQSVIGEDLLNSPNPVVTHRDPDSQIINTILSTHLAYTAAQDGVFVHGTCLRIPEYQVLPITECASLYDTQLATTRASDILIKGDLLPMLMKASK